MKPEAENDAWRQGYVAGREGGKQRCPYEGSRMGQWLNGQAAGIEDKMRGRPDYRGEVR